MTTIPTNIDSLLSTRLSGEKMFEYLAIKAQTADSSLDSLGLAWMYRDSVASGDVVFFIAIFAISFLYLCLIFAECK